MHNDFKSETDLWVAVDALTKSLEIWERHGNADSLSGHMQTPANAIKRSKHNKNLEAGPRARAVKGTNVA